jgi:D-alanine transaminase
MSRIVYVNGRYLPYAHAAVHVEDRGFQLADAVYEVIEVLAGRLIDEQRHLARLERSLSEIGMRPPMSRAALAVILRRTLRLNHVHDGTLYLQVSRGAAPRDFLFPAGDVLPSVVCIARPGNPARIEALAATGIAVKTLPDLRWGRRDIKTVMLLPACLAKEAAKAEGAREAWLVDAEGFVTEGASSNAWIVDASGCIITRQLSQDLLPGVTRSTLLDAIAALGLPCRQRPFTVTEAKAASEAFITAASQTVMPVVRIDGHPVGSGRPGPLVHRLRSNFHQFARASTA